MNKVKVVLSVFFLMLGTIAMAQCPAENKAFKPGEKLTYDLYFNWHFIWVKAGTAYYTTKTTNYKGKQCLRTDLLTLSNKRCSAVFPMKDTIMAYLSDDMVPQYYRKGANEGGKYTIEEVWYNYSNNKVNLKQRYTNRFGKVTDYANSHDECVYDMASMLSFARSFDEKKYCKKTGQRFTFLLASGDKIREQIMVFNGRKQWKANDGVTYKCLLFSLVDDEDEKKERTLLSFYITDDANHLPVRIDFFLKFGSAKAFLTKSENLRNPQTSIVKK